jgi:hypothetical protein
MREARIVSTQSELGVGRAPSAPVNSSNRSVKRAGRLRAALLWGGLGFIAGAVFWHLVGFWSFIAEVVLDRAPAAQAAVVAPPSAVSGPTVVLVEAERCTTLALDRSSNLTMAVPCANEGAELRLLPDTATRADLAALTAPHLQAAGYRPD